MKSIQWAPSGNALDGIPGEMLQFLAVDGRTFGYGYGPGGSIEFGHDRGSISVVAGQWVTRHDDGALEVTDDEPHEPAAGASPSKPWRHTASNYAGETIEVGAEVTRLDNYRGPRRGRVLVIDRDRGYAFVLVRWPNLDDQWMPPGILVPVHDDPQAPDSLRGESTAAQ